VVPDKLKGGEARVLVVNSGNANAFHRQGRSGGRPRDRRGSRRRGAVPSSEVFMASTGCHRGTVFPPRKSPRSCRLAAQGAAGNWRAAADAIMTTDTLSQGGHRHRHH
jgi:glutamate N-acetyltransferase/amino-acid N-acetyltransferase